MLLYTRFPVLQKRPKNFCLSSFDFMTSWRFLKLDYLPKKNNSSPRTADRVTTKKGWFCNEYSQI